METFKDSLKNVQARNNSSAWKKIWSAAALLGTAGALAFARKKVVKKANAKIRAATGTKTKPRTGRRG
jgi:hypothetical protein